MSTATARSSNYAALIRKTIWTRTRRCIKGSQRSVAASPSRRSSSAAQLNWTTCYCWKTGSDTKTTANSSKTWDILYYTIYQRRVSLKSEPRLANCSENENPQSDATPNLGKTGCLDVFVGVREFRFRPCQSWPGWCARHIHSAQRTSILYDPIPIRFDSESCVSFIQFYG